MAVRVEPVEEPNTLFIPPDLKPPKTDAHHVTDATPCCVCGGPVEPGGRYFGPWRFHPSCEPIAGEETGRLIAAAMELGLGLIERQDAALLPVAVNRYDVTHPEPTWTDEPGRSRRAWAHVDSEANPPCARDGGQAACRRGTHPDRVHRRAVRMVRVVEATGWRSEGHAWSDGSPAPLCGECWRVFVKCASPSPQYPEDARPAIAEAVTGVPVMVGEHVPDGLVPFIETTNAEPGEPWAHLNAEAVDSYRWTQWAKWGGSTRHPSTATKRYAGRRGGAEGGGGERGTGPRGSRTRQHISGSDRRRLRRLRTRRPRLPARLAGAPPTPPGTPPTERTEPDRGTQTSSRVGRVARSMHRGATAW